MLAAVILSAGQSSRMGTPKALVDFRGQTFLARLLEATRHPKIGFVRVVLGAGDEEIRPALGLPDEIVILNRDWQRGQLSSIQAGLRGIAAEDIDGMLLCPVDHPLVSRALVGALIATFYSDAKPSIVVPTFRGRRGHPVIFSRLLFHELLAAPDDQGARAVVWAHTSEVAEVPTEEEGVVLNLNDPETLRHARGDGERD
ncbi:MAG: nucleotidyltransferase family protein [Candidatus Acidiferrales bacterium]